TKDPPFNLPPSDYAYDPNRRLGFKQVAQFMAEPVLLNNCLSLCLEPIRTDRLVYTFPNSS
ncbi:hypothetical protein TorRG33x02_305480, partial [Trema orientale]